MILPSNELLSEVLEYTVVTIDDITDDELIYNDGKYINIYELKQKMKKWILKKEKGYYINIELWKDVVSISITDEENKGILFEEIFNTEFEAVCKATQYVYDNLSNK